MFTREVGALIDSAWLVVVFFVWMWIAFNKKSPHYRKKWAVWATYLMALVIVVRIIGKLAGW